MEQQVVTNENYLRYNEFDREEKSAAFILDKFIHQQLTKYDDLDYTDKMSMLLTENKFVKEQSPAVLFNRLEPNGRSYLSRTSTEQLEQYQQPYVQFDLNLSNKQLITTISRQELSIITIIFDSLASAGGLYKSLQAIFKLVLGLLLMPYITFKETAGLL